MFMNNTLNYDKEYANELLHFAGGYPDWLRKYHHAGFDIVANRILEVVKKCLQENHENFCKEICFWVTGHSMGAGVANIVSANLIHGLKYELNEENGIIKKYEVGGQNNIYCYTFAAPNTFYRIDNIDVENSTAKEGEQFIIKYREPKSTKYRCIFNIVNDDDFVPKVPMKDCNWTKYGRIASISFNCNKYNIEKIVKNEEKYKTINYDRTVTKDYIHNQYKGDIETIESIVKSFNSIFEDDLENMRYSAYTFKDDDYIYLSFAPDVVEAPMPKNAKPYQKINNGGESIIEYQMPAYFMQYIAFTRRGTLQGVGFFLAGFNKRYLLAKDTLVDRRSMMESPHLLETYYLLTKYVLPNSFN